MSFIFVLLAVVYFLYFYRRNKDLLNPNMIFLVFWNLACALSCIEISSFFSKWSFTMYFVTIISGLFFFLGSLSYFRSSTVKIGMGKTVKRILPSKFYFITYFLFIVCILCAILEWINAGSPISFQILTEGTDVKSELDGAIPGVHYGTIFLPYVSIFVFFSLMNSDKNKKINIIIILFSILFSIISNLSRGELLIYILSMFYLYYRYKKISKKQTILIVASSIIMLIYIMIIRVNSESVVLTMTSNQYLSVFYSYISPCFANLNDLINSDLPSNLYGNATFRPVWTIIGVHSDMEVQRFDQFGVFNAVPYIYGFYHDYKIFGIIFFPFLFGFIISQVYYYASFSNYWIILLASLMKAIFLPFFGNYFTGEMVLLFPYLLITIIILILPKSKLKNENFTNK